MQNQKCTVRRILPKKTRKRAEAKEIFRRKIYPAEKLHIPHSKIKHTNIKNMSAIAQITNRCVSVASVSRKTQTKRVAAPVR